MKQETTLKNRLALRSLLDGLAAAAMIAASVVLIWTSLARRTIDTAGAAPPLPSAPIKLSGAALKGSPRARVALIEYCDFQCPYCAVFAIRTLPAIVDKYVATGKLLVAFHHLPLERIHHLAFKAAEAAECAGHQGKFWEMHDALFQGQEHLDEASLHQRAMVLGLDMKRFTACLAGETIEKIRREAEEAGAVQVSGTPSFLLGLLQPDGRVKVRQRGSGSVPLSTLARAIDDLLLESGNGK